VLAARWDLAAVRARAAAGGEIPAVLRGLVRPPRADDAPAVIAPAAPDGLAGRLAGLDRVAAAAAVQDVVRTQVAASLHYDSAAAIDVDTPLKELGMDSLTAVELRNGLSRQTGLRLPATLVFNVPTVAGLADYLFRELVPAPPALDEVLRRALDQVTASLDDAEQEERDRVVAVLLAAVARLDKPGERTDPLAQLGITSDEEMFRFIDSQL
jgi:acyl carrier protein